ncbi:hypothetical protein SAZ11_08120 [Streptomyces sp. FXJ1.4098]|nr:hypothetical protein [Streptomyces sp. FXJ1.4098]
MSGQAWNEGESGMGLVGSLFLLCDRGLQLGAPRFELRDARVGSEGFSHALQHCRRILSSPGCVSRCCLVRGCWHVGLRFLRDLGSDVGVVSGWRTGRGTIAVDSPM